MLVFDLTPSDDLSRIDRRSMELFLCTTNFSAQRDVGRDYGMIIWTTDTESPNTTWLSSREYLPVYG